MTCPDCLAVRAERNAWQRLCAALDKRNDELRRALTDHEQRATRHTPTWET